MSRTLLPADRAVSVAVTHVLTIGITTILIAGLLVGATGLLDGEKNRAGDRELRSIGETIATEMVTVSETAQERNADKATLRTNHPEAVVGDSYSIRLQDGSTNCASRSGYDACLVLTAPSADVELDVPINFPGDVTVEPTGVSGGDIVIEYERDGSDEEITIRQA
jgi:hypothetical protein